MMQRRINMLTHKYKQITVRVMSIIQKAGPISGESTLTTKIFKTKIHVRNKDINATYVMPDQGQPVSLEQVKLRKILVSTLTVN